MNRDEIANRLVFFVFVTLFFSGLSSIYISHAVMESDVPDGTTIVMLNTNSKSGNIAASTFFCAGAILSFLVTIMLGLQLKKLGKTA
jgi:hypothetical protein